MLVVSHLVSSTANRNTGQPLGDSIRVMLLSLCVSCLCNGFVVFSTTVRRCCRWSGLHGDDSKAMRQHLQKVATQNTLCNTAVVALYWRLTQDTSAQFSDVNLLRDAWALCVVMSALGLSLFTTALRCVAVNIAQSDSYSFGGVQIYNPRRKPTGTLAENTSTHRTLVSQFMAVSVYIYIGISAVILAARYYLTTGIEMFTISVPTALHVDSSYQKYLYMFILALVLPVASSVVEYTYSRLWRLEIDQYMGATFNTAHVTSTLAVTWVSWVSFGGVMAVFVSLSTAHYCLLAALLVALDSVWTLVMFLLAVTQIQQPQIVTS